MKRFASIPGALGVAVLALAALFLCAAAITWRGAHFVDRLYQWVTLGYIAGPWLAVAALLIALPLLWSRAWLGLVASLAAAAVWGGPISGQLLPHTVPDAPASSLRVKVMSFNIGSYAPQRDGKTLTLDEARTLAELIAREQPDIVMLQESSEFVWRDIEPELLRLPAGVRYRATPSSVETMIVSAYPVRLAETHSVPMPAARAVVSTPAGEIDVWSIHTTRDTIIPIRSLLNNDLGPLHSRTVRAQLRWLGQQLARRDVPVIVGGDFNTPSFSPILEPLESDLDEVQTTAGWGPGFTFPAVATYTRTQSIRGNRLPLWSPIPLARIDHVFVSGHFTALRAYVGGETVGSDHAPAIAELAFNPHR